MAQEEWAGKHSKGATNTTKHYIILQMTESSRLRRLPLIME